MQQALGEGREWGWYLTVDIGSHVGGGAYEGPIGNHHCLAKSQRSPLKEKLLLIRIGLHLGPRQRTSKSTSLTHHVLRNY